MITIIGASPCLDRVDDQRIREKFLAHKPVRGQDGIVRLVLIDQELQIGCYVDSDFAGLWG